MKYIGNKFRLLDFIEESMEDFGLPRSGTFIDLFSGSTSVSQYFKKNYTIISNDFMYYSFVYQKCLIENNMQPSFKKISEKIKDNPINYLNSISPMKGYFFQNFAPSGQYSRMYFSDSNAMKIDSIRDTIEDWHKERLIDDAEFYYLLCSLIEAADFIANIAGTYGAFLKIWRETALKQIKLKDPKLIDNQVMNKCYNCEASELIGKIDGEILYLDPPYNSRQYASNFHVLESLAVWDKAELKGKTGLRNYDKQKSAFSSKKLAKKVLEKIIDLSRSEYIVLSYNNEGIIPHNDIEEILSKYGKFKKYSREYRRFRTERNHEKRRYKETGEKVYESLFILRKSK
jgi:adenine-specific DNA-methyltransferase